jgi:hypothetical protein
MASTLLSKRLGEKLRIHFIIVVENRPPQPWDLTLSLPAIRKQFQTILQHVQKMYQHYCACSAWHAE